MIFPILYSLVALAVVGSAFAFMGLALGRIASMINVGTRDETHTDFIASRVKMVIQIVFGHKKTLEDPTSGLLHMAFIYGFFILGIGHTEIVLEGITYFLKAFGREPFLYERLPGMSHHHSLIQFYHITQDTMAFLVFTACVIALYRRWSGVVPRLQPRSGDAEAILYFIGFLYFTFFLLNGTGRLMHNNFIWTFDWSQPFSSLAAYPWTRVATPATIQSWNFFSWWMHVFTFLLFGCYIPLSKHMHLVFAGPNTYFFQKGPYAWRQPPVVAAEKAKPPAARARPMGLPPKINFDIAEKFGIDRIDELPWKTLLDGFACTECGRCNDVCPAHLTGKPLKPKKVLHDLKVNLKHNGPKLLETRDLFGRPVEANKDKEAALELEPLITKEEQDRSDPMAVRPLDGMYLHVDGQIHADEAWACTTCGACFEACPVLIDSVPGALIGIRQSLVMMESDMSPEVQNTLKNIERRGNPWGLGQDKRMDWAEGLEVPVFADIVAETPEREVEYLFWVGCAGSTDDSAKKVQQSLVRILKAAKVDYAVLGCEEKCTGDPARRLGNEALFNQLAQENIEVLKQYKFKKIFTTCPHCFNSLKQEYGEFGVDYSVQHHTELLAELLKDKRIPLDTKNKLDEHVTFHDPCYLGRYNKQYDAPREVLYAIGDKSKIKEMERSKEKSFCCGAGGGRMFMEEHIGDRVNVKRTEQAMDTGATTVAVGCPFCKVMITDGTKAKDVEEKIKVRDIAELLADRLA
ncbi:MAG: (Fe-S)-binding protein [Deltaproteobacteria bacterium]|nr:(Fe-S)-binding protein [Deltaproteobacteria bacterium]